MAASVSSAILAPQPPTRRRVRILPGIAAAGILTAALIAPTAAHADTAVPTAECSALLEELGSAQEALVSAKAAHQTALVDKETAKAALDDAQTRRLRRAFRAAVSEVRATRDARDVARGDRDLASTGFTGCLPGVTVANPRMSFHGSWFGVADVTWNNIPYGEYHGFNYYDDTVVYQGPVTFVDVVPPPPPLDPFQPFPINWVSYRQSGVTNVGQFLGGVNGSGCDYSPGQNVTLELWTGRDGANPTGVKVASATVDNPCR